jgi:hypothetical protein
MGRRFRVSRYVLRVVRWGMLRREGPGTRSGGRWHYSDGDVEVPADVVVRKDPYAQRPRTR